MSFRIGPRRVGLVLAAAALGGWIPEVAHAANPDCADISGGAPILYGAGGSAQRPLVLRAAAALQSASSPIWIAYKDDGGACTGINALAGLADTTITGSAKYWDPAAGGGAGAEATCSLALAGNTVTFASMGNAPALCPLVTDPSLVADIHDVTGPVTTVNIVVPNASTQQAISAEALYLVYGFGASAGVAPWTNASGTYYIRRNENSYVQQYIGLATGLPATKFIGTDAGTNGATITLLTALADPEAAIGFASGEVSDANRATVRTLAYQHKGQNVAYWPDSTATAFDKINVRTGAYFLWGPGHFYALKGATPGSYANANAKVLLDFLSDKAIPAGVTANITDIAIANRNIPTCAMQVQRDSDLAPIYAYTPPEPCGCYFDFKATGSTTCASCDEGSPCSTGVCRLGYCEAK